MKSYYRIMLGRKSVFAEECLTNGYIGVSFGIEEDLTNKLPEEWRPFNREYIPLYIKNTGKSKVAAGLACGFLWTVCKKVKLGDIVICPDGTGSYRIGEVTGGYTYHPGTSLQHRRAVRWLNTSISRGDMSEALRNSAGSIGTVSDVSRYAEELERLIGGTAAPTIISTDASVEDASAFVMEKHLEHFLVENWAHTEIGKLYDIYQEDGETVGQQYPTDTGPLDILAISKDKKSLLVVELKKGRASDVVVGQTLRYMGYVQEELIEPTQTVRGVIIALEDDQRLRRALTMTPNIEFYRYQISFKLLKV